MTTPNRPFSTSTQEAARKPTSTLSCSVKMAQAATEQTKTVPMIGPLSPEYDVPHQPAVSTKRMASTTEPTALTVYARSMNDRVRSPACGMNLLSAPLKLCAVKPASRFIAA